MGSNSGDPENDFGIGESLLQKSFKNRLETNEESYERIHRKETLLQKLIRRKWQLSRNICRMDKGRKIREIVFWNGRWNEYERTTT